MANQSKVLQSSSPLPIKKYVSGPQRLRATRYRALAQKSLREAERDDIQMLCVFVCICGLLIVICYIIYVETLLLPAAHTRLQCEELKVWSAVHRYGYKATGQLLFGAGR